MPQQELLRFLPEFDVFLCPSLRESGGMAVLEALSAGLPVICLETPGSRAIMDESCGCMIPIAGRTKPEVEAELARALLDIGAETRRYAAFRSAAIRRAATFAWPRVVAELYGGDAVLDIVRGARPATATNPRPVLAGGMPSGTVEGRTASATPGVLVGSVASRRDGRDYARDHR
jgi:hypothetical protein